MVILWRISLFRRHKGQLTDPTGSGGLIIPGDGELSFVVNKMNVKMLRQKGPIALEDNEMGVNDMEG